MQLYTLEQRRPVRASVLPSSPLGLLDQTRSGGRAGRKRADAAQDQGE